MVPKAGTVRVLRGKGKKAQTVGLDPGAMAALERWLDKRAKLGLTGREPLFCSITKGQPFGRPLYPQSVRQAVNRLAERAGIEKRVHPHGLRHAHAAELAAEGVPVNVVQRQLGHASLAVTSRYLDHIAPADLIERMHARGWSLSLSLTSTTTIRAAATPWRRGSRQPSQEGGHGRAHQPPSFVAARLILG
jgi:site-specific recombinase XerD